MSSMSNTFIVNKWFFGRLAELLAIQRGAEADRKDSESLVDTHDTSIASLGVIRT